MPDFLQNVLTGEAPLFERLLQAGFAALVWLGAALLAAAVVASIYTLIADVLRRQERARCFLDLLETGLGQGLSPEQITVSLSQARVQAMGVLLHLVAAHIENGLRLSAALDKVPSFLPPPVRAMLKVGESIGDVRKVLPACRAVLQRTASAAQISVNNLVVVLTVCPVGAAVNWMFMVFVLPKFKQVASDMGVASPWMTGEAFRWSYTLAWAVTVLWLVVYVLECFPGAVPRLRMWMGHGFGPVFHGVDFALPWRRQRMHRDFSAMLALLLDAGLPEAQALRLAAQSSANDYFIARAEEAARDLQRGVPLPEAVRRLDDAGEFQWRLRNAAQAKAGFMAALRGWHDALEAKAFQQEQAASQIVTTGFVLMNGLMVGLLALGVFGLLISILDLAAL
jgi:type II secretory pathway component PulF